MPTGRYAVAAIAAAAGPLLTALAAILLGRLLRLVPTSRVLAEE